MLSKSWGYAVRAMVRMAETHSDPKHRWSSDELAEAAGLPPSFLAKVMQQLTAAGLVESVRGRGGGIRLARNPSAIRLYDIALSTEDNVDFGVDGAGLEDAAPELLDELHRRWHPYGQAIREFLALTTIADLAASGSANAQENQS
jgi:Rrf2 family transcriptional regulator, iron-sulfur cluster assembly transcription factor